MPPDYSPLSMASDAELVDELARRAKSSPVHGMILIKSRPVEGDPDRCEGDLTVSGTNPKTLQYLVSVLASQFKLKGLPTGQVEIPEITLGPDGQASIRGELHPQGNLNEVDAAWRWLNSAPGMLQLPGITGAELYTFLRPEAIQLLLVKQGYGYSMIPEGILIFQRTGANYFIRYNPGVPLPQITLHPVQA